MDVDRVGSVRLVVCPFTKTISYRKKSNTLLTDLSILR